MKQFLIGLLACMCVSASVLFNIYEALEVTEDKAKKDLLTCIGEGWYVTHDNHKLKEKAKELSADLQVEGIKQLIATAKAYTETEAFEKAYKKWRNEKLNPGTKSKLGIPKLGKILEKKVDDAVNGKDDQDDRYPADSKAMIKKRLQHFLDLSATVDFKAELNSNRSFKKEEYERKNGEWKMLYRMGKEVIEAAQVEIRKWLEELDKKKA